MNCGLFSSAFNGVVEVALNNWMINKKLEGSDHRLV